MQMQIRKDLIRTSYDKEAKRYEASSNMQSGNLNRLIDVAKKFIRKKKVNSVLDLGCGLGVLVGLLEQRPVISYESYTGIDLSKGMIQIAKKNYASEKVKFLVKDIETLDVADTSMNIVFSNSVLHWLNQPKLGGNLNKAISEISRVLADKGIFCASIAGAGTAKRFLKSYNSVMKRHQNNSYFDKKQYVADPIGCMELNKVVTLLMSNGLKVKFAHLEYEPLTFESAAGYVNAVRAYGYKMFMAPVEEVERRKIWDEVSREFVEQVGDQEYYHDQYMIYVVAEK